MKRGKDDEKIMGPMFPRLHVNDTEKGGPRAPPRNKMALYEQLSVPSQRFNRPGTIPLDHNNNANFIPPASSSQGHGHDGSRFFPVQVPPSRHPVQNPPSRYLDPSASLVQAEQRKKLDEDYFAVPIFVHSKAGQDSGDYHNNMDRENLSPSSAAYSSYSMKLQNASNKDPKQAGIMGLNVRQNAKKQNENTIEDILASRKQNKTVSNSQLMDDVEGPPKRADASLSSELRDDTSNAFRRLQKACSRLQPGQGADSQPGLIKGHVFDSQLIDVNHENSSLSPRNCPLEVQRNLDDVINDAESREEQTCRSSQPNVEYRGDDVSETSMVESVSGIDISPDDVVGIIGQKHFWKARRAIVNQQRVFAVQVFELHRLIKVQRLIAESPHLLLEDSAYLGKPIKVSTAKKFPLEYIVKTPANILKHKNESEKPIDKMECSAENTVEKVSLSSVQNGSQPLSYRQFAGNPPVTPVTSDPNMGPRCFHPTQGHQWLVPVMSPSEGLIYKPYSGSGFPNPVCGGCGPPGSTPMMGNFLPPAYGVPASRHHYQGIGVPTLVPPAGPHGYFPPYGMPVMNPAISGQSVELMSHFATQGLQGQLSGGGANFSVQHQNSCNLPGQKSGTVSDIPNLNASKDSELQASTASSPIERAEGTGLGNTTEGNNVLPLFPTSPATNIPNGSARHHVDEQPARVIRVVPHNGRSASEFAARIFRSIQEERKQNDTV